MVEDAQLRVSNLQRDNAVRILRDAAADGRLTFDELEQRVPVALVATTRGALAEVLGDLVPEADMAAAIADPQVRGDGPGYRWEEPLVLETSGMTDIHKRGKWVIPPFVEVVIGAATVKLNCVDATPAADLIDLSLVAGSMGTLVLIVPEGWGVDTSGVQTGGQAATVSTKVRTRPTPGNPRIVLRGRTEFSVRVRHPNWFDRRALERARRALPAG